MSMHMDPEREMAREVAVPRVHARAARARTVIVVMVALKWDVEHCHREVKAISQALRGLPWRPALHGRRQIGFVIQSDVPAADVLGVVLKEALSAGCVERAWAFTPGADIACVEPMDALTDRVAEAWRAVRRHNAKFSRLSKGWIFERREPMPDGRGETITTILDNHPLDPAV